MFELPSSQQICSGVGKSSQSVSEQKKIEPAKQEVKPVARKVSGRDMPNFSFTGDMRVVRKSETEQGSGETVSISPLSGEDMDKIRGSWPQLHKNLETAGKIRLLAAISHSRFEGGNLVITVANRAIEQEVIDARADIQEMLLALSGVRVGIKVEVTADEVFINKPVSDSQRLQAIIQRCPDIKVLCEQLRLKL